MKIAIFGNQYQNEALAHIEHLLGVLSAHHVKIFIEQDFLDYLQPLMKGLPAMQPFRRADYGGAHVDADVVLSIGGDGTFLRTAQAVAQQHVPIIGINSGRLGYLTTASANEAPQVINDLLTGNYRVENRAMLQVTREDRPERDYPFALNEVAVFRQDTPAMIDVDVHIGANWLTTFRGDGFLVCTPTGSTAYNMSVGGPILEPLSQCLALSPISPHSLTMRPLVISDSSVLRITTHSRATYFQLSIDGETEVLPSGTTLMVKRAPCDTRVILLPGRDFATTMRDKLMWGRDGL